MIRRFEFDRQESPQPVNEAFEARPAARRLNLAPSPGLLKTAPRAPHNRPKAAQDANTSPKTDTFVLFLEGLKGPQPALPESSTFIHTP